MSRWLYEIGIRCYGTALHGIAPFHKKARKWVDGRKGVFKHVKEVRDTFTLAPAHFHCASLGEYEQALPIIECYHQKHPKRPISISFFSPSGFEHAKLPDWVSLVFYLPLDLKKNARKLTDTLNPHFFAGIKYEVWPNIIGCFKAQGTPCFLLCGNFRTDHIYFKPRGQFLLETLKQFEAISVQNSSSKKLLAKYNIPANNFGDSRFDRVMEVAKQPWQDQRIESFLQGEKALILGSTWEAEISLLNELLSHYKKEGVQPPKIILAPHKVDAGSISKYRSLLDADSSLYSEDSKEKSEVLIMDGVGKLKYLYRYGFSALVGGGFSNALHNILEPLAYQLPTFFGSNTSKYPEGKSAIEAGAACSVNAGKEWYEILQNPSLLEKMQQNAKLHVQNNLGASVKNASLLPG